MSVSGEPRVEVHVVGPHRVDLEFPDLVHIHYYGDVELEHYIGFNEVMVALPRSSSLYLLRDARHGGLVTPETRRRIATTHQDGKFVAILTYGSSFQTKTVFANMNRALRTMRPDTGAPQAPVEFFETETDARAWIAAYREVLAQK